MDRITIGGKALDVPEYAFNSGYRTVLDSGTTFIYLTTPLYRKFAAVIRAAAVAAGLRETTDSYGDICWTGAAANWDELSRYVPLVACLPCFRTLRAQGRACGWSTVIQASEGFFVVVFFVIQVVSDSQYELRERR